MGKVAFAVLACIAWCANATTLSYEGTFTTDDEIQYIDFVVSVSQTVTVQTFGYAGGVDGNGIVVPEGGFDPFLTLFDSGGNFLAANDDAGCGLVNRDSGSGGCADSYIQLSLDPGTYTLALTQTGNEPKGIYLSDGFTEQGQGNYSCGGGFGNFCDPATYTDRTGNWALDISGLEAGATAPEPATFDLLTFAGACIALVSLRRRPGRSWWP